MKAVPYLQALAAIILIATFSFVVIKNVPNVQEAPERSAATTMTLNITYQNGETEILTLTVGKRDVPYLQSDGCIRIAERLSGYKDIQYICGVRYFTFN